MFDPRFNSGLAFILMINLISPALAQESLIARVQKSEQSIVTVQAQIQDTSTLDGRSRLLERTGSGIIIDPAGYIVTNTHTILYAQRIIVTLPAGARVAATVAFVAPEWDFSVLKIDPPFSLKALPWADSDRIELGDSIVAVGNSGLLKETISGGTVKSIGQKQSGSHHRVDMIETDFNVYSGDSGGPILDRQGRFLGIIAAKNKRRDHSSWAIPANTIREQFLHYLTGAHP